MPRDRFDSYPFYFRDWRASKRVKLLTAVQKAVYRELIDHYWESGFLPGDVEEVFKLLSFSRREFNQGKSVIDIFFRRGDDGNYYSEEMDEKRNRILNIKSAQRLAAELTNAKRTGDRHANRPSDRPIERPE
jgi:uncharacterized protein YdaU (DUF1376 family)